MVWNIQVNKKALIYALLLIANVANHFDYLYSGFLLDIKRSWDPLPLNRSVIHLKFTFWTFLELLLLDII